MFLQGSVRGVRMSRYERAWWISTRCVTAVGLAIACGAWGLAVAAWVFSVGFVMGATAAILMNIAVTSLSLRRIAAAGSTGGLVVLGIGGLTVVLQLWALAVAMVVLIFSPRILYRLAGRTPNASRANQVEAAPVSAVMPDPPSPRTPVGSLSDQALRRAWQSSHHELMRAQSLSARTEIVQLRQEYLDELERRDPAALSAWFASGA